VDACLSVHGHFLRSHRIVTAEIFAGRQGVGGLLTAAASTANADLTMAVIMLSVIGVAAVGAAEALRRRLLPWRQRPFTRKLLVDYLHLLL
jgi:ABC-type nitrate/sulfonate/bicarbonate transport system permease component